jgi:hypothetical protein
MSDFEMAAEWYFREPCGRSGLVDRFLTVKLGRSEQPLHTPDIRPVTARGLELRRGGTTLLCSAASLEQVGWGRKSDEVVP